MKIFVYCLFATIFSLVFADIKHKENAVENKVDDVASVKNTELKSKRDASLLVGSYHGPSYKYLPPFSVSSYDSNAGSDDHSFKNSGVYTSGIENSYKGGGIGRVHGHFGYSANSRHNNGGTHGLGYAPINNYYHSEHHGLGYNSGPFTGHGSVQYSSGNGRSAGPLNVATFGHGGFPVGRVHSYGLDHSSVSSDASDIGYKSKSHSVNGDHIAQFSGEHVGQSMGSRVGYYYSKGFSGTLPSSNPVGFSSDHTFSNPQGPNLAKQHYGDHVHNSGREHLFIIPNGPSNIGDIRHEGGSELPNSSYLPPIQQHTSPSGIYSVPISNVGDAYNAKYHSQTSEVAKQEPTYATGHKGLGHFSFTATKPQVLHTSIFGPSFKQPSFSKAPFKPSIFLGAKYEGTSHASSFSQHYLLPSGVGSDSTSYNYSKPPSSSTIYQEPNYQHSVEVQSISVHEPDSTYLPPKNEIPSSPSESYSNTYKVPSYSH